MLSRLQMTSNRNFVITPPVHEYPLSQGEIENARPVSYPEPAQWVNEKLKIPSGTGYTREGKVTLDPVQSWVVNKMCHHRTHEFVLSACTQWGKSFQAEVGVLYKIKHGGARVLIVYDTKEKIPDIIGDRFQPMIKENLPELMTGNPDDFKVEKIKMKTSIVRTQSANQKVATHAYDIVYCSETGKWPRKNYDQLKQCKGRFTSVIRTGRYLLIIESSPFEEGDLFDIECNRIKTHVYPFVKCPSCGKRFFLEDVIIKEIPNKETIVCDHDPDRILAERAAYCECPHCRSNIHHNLQYKLLQDVIWMTENDAKNNPHCDIQPDYMDIPEIVAHINKLYTIDYSFSQCLHNYFSALYSEDPIALAEYEREDMARPKRRGTGKDRMSEVFITSKAKQYNQWDDQFPDEIQFCMAGIDVMKEFCTYVVRGFNPECNETWLMRSDRILIDPLTINSDRLKDLLNEKIFRYNWMRREKTTIPIIWGFIDIGFRQDLAMQTAQKIPILHGYKGDTKQKNLILKSKNGTKWGDFYLGHSEMLSGLVEKYASANTWYMPGDYSPQYIEEFLGEYWETKKRTNGTTYTEFVKTEKNHSRSCENMIMGACQLLNVQTNPDRAVRLARKISTPKIEVDTPKPENKILKSMGRSSSNWLRR